MELLKDKQVLVVQKESANIITRAKNFHITSEEKASDANNVLHWIAKAKKAIEERRKFFVTPLKAHVRDIEAEFKVITGPLIQADAIIRSKVVDYRVRIEEEARKKEEELRRKAEAKQKKVEEKAKSKGEVPPPPPPLIVVEPPKTTEGVTLTKNWTYGIVDINKVPREYLTLDTVAVMRAVNLKVRNIPGLRIYQKPSIKVGG